MADKAQVNRKRKKKFYLKAAKGKRFKHGHVLEAGLKGFLITCNNREKEAVREAYNILNEYAENSLENKEQEKEEGGSQDDDGTEDESEEEEDIEAALAKEVSALKNQKSSQRRFQVVESGANNCIFIKTTEENPDQLLHRIFTDLHESQKCKSRFIMRFMPVVGTCRTDPDRIMKLGTNLLPQYFGTGGACTYCVIVKVRNNNQFSRHQVLPVLREVIQELNPNHGFDADDPDYVISMDIIKSVCCMSVMRNYFKFRKYNMQEVVKTESDVKSLKKKVENKDSEEKCDGSSVESKWTGTDENSSEIQCTGSSGSVDKSGSLENTSGSDEHDIGSTLSKLSDTDPEGLQPQDPDTNPDADIKVSEGKVDRHFADEDDRKDNSCVLGGDI